MQCDGSWKKLYPYDQLYYTDNDGILRQTALGGKSGDLGLTFVAVDGPATVSLEVAEGSATQGGIKYGTHGTANKSYTIGQAISLENGGHVSFANESTTLNTLNSKLTFRVTGYVKCFGNLCSMINYSSTCTAYCFEGLFKECEGLLRAPDILATTAAYSCCKELFSGCSNIEEHPEIAFTKRASHDCYRMFRDCDSLKYAKKIPATNLEDSCNAGMYQSCSNLITTDDLDHTYCEGESCCSAMFLGCWQLRSNPKLPKTLSMNCFGSMFASSGVYSMHLPYTLPYSDGPIRCFYMMFKGSRLRQLEVDFDTWGEGINDPVYNYSRYTYDWLDTRIGDATFICPEGLQTNIRDNDHIPEGWNIITK